jgi:hypothetical protein
MEKSYKEGDEREECLYEESMVRLRKIWVEVTSLAKNLWKMG